MGQRIFFTVCHGSDLRSTGPLAHKSSPPTPDSTTRAFKRRRAEYSGVIVSSVIPRPNGNLIPKTLKENGMKVPPHAWTIKNFRDLNEYRVEIIRRSKQACAERRYPRSGLSVH
ncbi:cytochrome c [Pseudomonas koreensis]